MHASQHQSTWQRALSLFAQPWLALFYLCKMLRLQIPIDNGESCCLCTCHTTVLCFARYAGLLGVHERESTQGKISKAPPVRSAHPPAAAVTAVAVLSLPDALLMCISAVFR